MHTCTVIMRSKSCKIRIGVVVLCLGVLVYICRMAVIKTESGHTFHSDWAIMRHTSYRDDHLQAVNFSKKIKNCTERRHLIFIRIPKTGSSTMTFLLWRFGLGRHLNFLLPKKGAEGNEPFLTSGRFFLPHADKPCDLMANHIIYNYSNFKPHFHSDTTIITLIRDPMDHFASMVYYLYESNEVTEDQEENTLVSQYLRNTSLLKQKEDVPFTHNLMTYYFGLQEEDFDKTEKVKRLISEVDEQFSLVLVLERFTESLVLLKRMMCWKMRDIIYVKINSNPIKPKNMTFTLQDRSRLKAWSTADCLLYDYFTIKLNKLIHREGPSFQDEVCQFKKHLGRFEEFCRRHIDGDEILQFESSPYNDQFEMTSSDCRIMTMRGLKFLDGIREQQKTSPFGCG